MKDSVLQKYLQQKPDPTVNEEMGADIAPDDLGAFGYLRGIHDRALMLELRHKNGNIDAFPYAWLNRATFDPSEGITLRFGAQTVKIAGQNLNGEVRPNVRLFAGIVRHRVPWVREADGPTALAASEKTTIIDRLDVTT